MNNAWRVAAGALGGGLMTAAPAAAANRVSRIGRAQDFVLNSAPHTRAAAPHMGEWHLALLVACALVLAGVAVATHRGRVRKATGSWAAIGLVATAAVVLLMLPAHPATSDSVHLTPTEQSFLAAINQVRTAHGESALTSQANLVRAARAHSDDMIQNHYFAHGVFWKRLEQFGVQARTVGENLAWNSTPQNAVGSLVHAWLNSPEHRRNLLSDKYTEVGVGVDVGPFDGYPDAVMVTTDFLGN